MLGGKDPTGRFIHSGQFQSGPSTSPPVVVTAAHQVPPLTLKAPAERPLVATVTVPALALVMAGKMAPDLGVKVWVPAVAASDSPRWKSGIAEFDFALGGGIVPGSMILIGGEPGIGKSTLLLQVAARLQSS